MFKPKHRLVAATCLLAVAGGASAHEPAVGDSSVRHEAAHRSAVPRKPGTAVRVETQTPDSLSAGETGEVVITLTPEAVYDELSITYRAPAGLQITASPVETKFAAPTAGEPIVQRLAVISGSEGVFHVSVVVTGTSGASAAPTARVFSVPVLVGEASRVAKALSKPAPALDSTGERIKPMRAEETVIP